MGWELSTIMDGNLKKRKISIDSKIKIRAKLNSLSPLFASAFCLCGSIIKTFDFQSFVTWPTLIWCMFSSHVSPTEILPASYPLQEAEIAVIGQNQCRCQYTPVVALLNNTQITDEMMCAQQDGRELCLVNILLC